MNGIPLQWVLYTDCQLRVPLFDFVTVIYYDVQLNQFKFIRLCNAMHTQCDAKFNVKDMQQSSNFDVRYTCVSDSCFPCPANRPIAYVVGPAPYAHRMS